MPVEFEALLTIQDFYMLSGLAGVVSAFIVLFIWGQSL